MSRDCALPINKHILACNDKYNTFDNLKATLNTDGFVVLKDSDRPFIVYLIKTFGGQMLAGDPDNFEGEFIGKMNDFRQFYIDVLEKEVLSKTSIKELAERFSTFKNADGSQQTINLTEAVQGHFTNGGSNILTPSMLDIVNQRAGLPRLYQNLKNNFAPLFAPVRKEYRGEQVEYEYSSPALRTQIKNYFEIDAATQRDKIGKEVIADLTTNAVFKKEIQDEVKKDLVAYDDTFIQGKVAKVETDLAKEIQDRKGTDTIITGTVSLLDTETNTKITRVENEYKAADTAIKSDLATERRNRQTADGGLGARITALNTKVDNLPQGGGGSAGIADGSITSAKLANQAVTAAKLGFNSVRNIHIASGSIQTRHIINKQITESKLADAVVAKLGGGGGGSANLDGITLNGNVYDITKNFNFDNVDVWKSTEKNYDRIKGDKNVIPNLFQLDGWFASKNPAVLVDGSGLSGRILHEFLLPKKYQAAVVNYGGNKVIIQPYEYYENQNIAAYAFINSRLRGIIIQTNGAFIVDNVIVEKPLNSDDIANKGYVDELVNPLDKKVTNVSHQLETHKAHLGITNDKVNSLADYNITDADLKSTWESDNNDVTSIFLVFNLMFNDASTLPVFAEGSISQVGNYFFSTIMRTERQRPNGYLNKNVIKTASHLRLAMGQTSTSRIITIFNADYGTTNYRSGIRFTQNKATGNWDGGRAYSYSANVDQYFVYETLDENSTFIKDGNGAVKTMAQWDAKRSANQFFKINQNKYLASSKNETNALDRVAGQANRWIPAKVAFVEKNTKPFPTIPNSAGITLSAGVYQIRFKHTFYDVGGGENYVRLDLSGNQNTDYLLSDWESVNGGFVPSQDVATHVYYCGGLIKVLTGKNVMIKPEVRTHKNTARSSGWGHKQSIARAIRQNEFRVVQLDSGTEPA